MLDSNGDGKVDEKDAGVWISKLLELLAHHEGPGVRLAAADALGNLGTEQSIQTLKETADPLRSGHVLTEACKDALRRVRSRLTRET